MLIRVPVYHYNIYLFLLLLLLLLRLLNSYIVTSLYYPTPHPPQIKTVFLSKLLNAEELSFVINYSFGHVDLSFVINYSFDHIDLFLHPVIIKVFIVKVAYL